MPFFSTCHTTNKLFVCPIPKLQYIVVYCNWHYNTLQYIVVYYNVSCNTYTILPCHTAWITPGYLISHNKNTKWPTLEDLLLHFGTTWFSPSTEILHNWPIIFDWRSLHVIFGAKQKFLSKTLINSNITDHVMLYTAVNKWPLLCAVCWPFCYKHDSLQSCNIWMCLWELTMWVQITPSYISLISFVQNTISHFRKLQKKAH